MQYRKALCVVGEQSSSVKHARPDRATYARFGHCGFPFARCFHIAVCSRRNRRAKAFTSLKEKMTQYSITLTVNGDSRELDLDPRDTLLDVLRDKLELRGTHLGC